MRKATQQDLDFRAQELKSILERLEFFDAYSVFKTYKDIQAIGVEHYSDEEIFNMYNEHKGGMKKW